MTLWGKLMAMSMLRKAMLAVLVFGGIYHLYAATMVRSMSNMAALWSVIALLAVAALYFGHNAYDKWPAKDWGAIACAVILGMMSLFFMKDAVAPVRKMLPAMPSVCSCPAPKAVAVVPAPKKKRVIQ